MNTCRNVITQETDGEATILKGNFEGLRKGKHRAFMRDLKKQTINEIKKKKGEKNRSYVRARVINLVL